MAFTHKAKHVVFHTGGAVAAYDELDDAVAAAESFAADNPEQEHRVAWIVPVTEVEDVS